VWHMVRGHWPFALSVAAPAAKSKNKLGASLVAFDFASLRSGRTETESTTSEEVYESRVVRFRCLPSFFCFVKNLTLVVGAPT
jgi:hypothetical protein